MDAIQLFKTAYSDTSFGINDKLTKIYKKS